MSMGRVLSRALEAAGLADFQARVCSGAALTSAELAQLSSVDLLLLAGLADAMRARFRGDKVRIVSSAAARDPELVVFDRGPSERGATGAELLRDLALLRLGTRPSISVGVSMETLGLELAQTALLFGADTLLGDLGSARTLPLLDGPSARRREIEGLVTRSGRRASFADALDQSEQSAEQAT
jgi:2-iminoacetate synthase ThiH